MAISESDPNEGPRDDARSVGTRHRSEFPPDMCGRKVAARSILVRRHLALTRRPWRPFVMGPCSKPMPLCARGAMWGQVASSLYAPAARMLRSRPGLGAATLAGALLHAAGHTMLAGAAGALTRALAGSS